MRMNLAHSTLWVGCRVSVFPKMGFNKNTILEIGLDGSNFIAICLIGHEELRMSFWGICQSMYLADSFIWLNVINFSCIIDFCEMTQRNLASFRYQLWTAVPSSTITKYQLEQIYHIANLIYLSFSNSNTAHYEWQNESSLIKCWSSFGILH